MNIQIFEDEVPQLETERLILKVISVTDLKDIFEIFSDEEVLKYYDIEPLKSHEEATNLIHLLDKRFKAKKAIRWGMHLKKTDKLIGTCGFQDFNIQSHRADVGYEMSKDFWGKGLMKEALKETTLFGFNIMALNRIQALVEPENQNSIKLLHSLGFHEEGILREYEFYRGKFRDLTILSLL